MSTQAVNANRLGPKNLMDLAQKAQAYKALLNAKENHEHAQKQEAMGEPSDMGFMVTTGGTAGTQPHLDDAFEHFANLHRDPETGKVNTAEMQATMNYLNQHIAKGKGL